MNNSNINWILLLIIFTIVFQNRAPIVYYSKIAMLCSLFLAKYTYLPQIKQEQSATKDLFKETSTYLCITYLAKSNN